LPFSVYIASYFDDLDRICGCWYRFGQMLGQFGRKKEEE